MVWFAIAAALYLALRDAGAERLGPGFDRARQWLRDAFRAVDINRHLSLGVSQRIADPSSNRSWSLLPSTSTTTPLELGVAAEQRASLAPMPTSLVAPSANVVRIIRTTHVNDVRGRPTRLRAAWDAPARPRQSMASAACGPGESAAANVYARSKTPSRTPSFSFARR